MLVVVVQFAGPNRGRRLKRGDARRTAGQDATRQDPGGAVPEPDRVQVTSLSVWAAERGTLRHC